MREFDYICLRQPIDFLKMSKYLDPKADLTFKKVFGEHRDLVVSFLNALLPFDSPEEEIKEVLEYLDPELMPRNPLKKYSVVDLRCRDARGRQFVVEMPMMWTSAFKQRVLFNASKAYVSRLEEGAFTDQQLLLYDRFWDMVSTSRTLINGAVRDATRKALQQGRQEGIRQERLKIAENMRRAGIAPEAIAQITGLTSEETVSLK